MGRKDRDELSAAEEFVADSDDGESALQAALEVDETTETWTFHDIGVDSGTFGELVSRGIVEKDNEEYHLSNPEEIRVALDHEAETTVATEQSGTELKLPSFSIDYRILIALLASLAVVAGARVMTFRRAFQNGYAISPANDPYFFRYWLDRILRTSNGITDVSVLSNGPFTGRRPFTHATNWFVAELLGGGEWAAATVAMWLPVVAAVVLGTLLYKLAVMLTRDPRVGLVTVLVFALTPVNAVYTSLGFLDHNYNQYFWLGVTLLTLGWLAVNLCRHLESKSKQAAISAHLNNGVTWVVAGACGLSIAFGTHAWGGSPLLLIPLAGYIGLRVPLDVRAGLPPLRTLAPTVSAIMIGGIVSFGLHSVWGWHTTFVALTPLVVACGGITVSVVGEVWRHQSLRTDFLFPVELGITTIGGYLFIFQILDDQRRVTQRVGDLFFRESAVETGSLFAVDSLMIFGPLDQLGLPFYFAIGALGWVAVRLSRTYEPGWLLIGTYTISLLIIAGVQTRFAGQLAVPLSILGGLGIIYGLAALGVVRYPSIDSPTAGKNTTSFNPNQSRSSVTLPDRRRMLYLCGICIVLFSANLIALPGAIGVHTYAPAHGDAVTAIDTHSDQVDREYPENYVLSGWSRNRMYNYFVNGESRRYGYARNNYESFVTASTPDSSYDQFNDRVGYVLIDSVNAEVPEESTQGQLLTYINISEARSNPPTHYQLLYTDADHSVATYAVVPGAQIVGQTVPGEQVVMNTSLSIDNRSFAYEWTATAGSDGRYAVTVPYPGNYHVGSATVEVPSAAVLNGTQVNAG